MNYLQSFRQMLHNFCAVSLVLIASIGVQTVNATPNRIDSSFYPIIDGNGTVYAIATQPDGKILVGGTISKVNGEEQTGIARLNPDGSVDLGFSPVTVLSSNLPGTIYSIKLQADNKILLGGNFRTVGGQTRNGIARLNSNGSLDLTFQSDMSGVGSSNVKSLAVQPDGKIVVGGDFFTFNGVVRNGLARLNPDGGLDASFADSGPSLVNSVSIQSDGKIIIGGRFGFTSPSDGKIKRLNADGSVDPTFLNGLSGANGDIEITQIQSDGKILAGGQFTSFNSVNRNRIVRLNTDGSVDQTFLNNLSGANNLISTVALKSDGKILVGGAFTLVNGVDRNKIAQLNTDGTIDSTFTSNFAETLFSLNIIAVQADGKILAGGFLNFGGQALRQGLARLNFDGTVDPTLAFIQLGEPGTVRNIARQADGKILVSGQFRYVNKISTVLLGRVNSDGSLDPTFSVGPRFNSNNEINTIVPLPNGKILIGGIFDILSPGSYRNIARLNSDGSVDTTFTQSNLSGNIESISLQPDGKIVVGGSFNFFNNVARNNLARLNPDGTVDTTFLNGLQGPNQFVLSTLVQSDSKIVIGGFFSQVNGISRLGIARLNNDGSLDTTFVGNLNGSVRDIKQQPDGKFVVGGSFTSVNGVLRNRIAKLNLDGSLDTAFLNGFSGANGEVLEIAIQSNGQIVIAGDFTTVNGISRKLARLNMDGSLDESFNFNLGPLNAIAYTLLIEPNGYLLIGGYFNKVNGVTRSGLFRVVQNNPLYDFDGDGKADVSVFRPSNGAWYINQSQDGFTGTTFGISTDKITPADYDGDGKTDLAVYRSGTWYLQRSQLGFTGIAFGTSEDIPAPADYDGDGKTDLAVFRPSNGTWYINRSQLGFIGISFGQNGDIPAAGDYDGDGKTDVAVFRPSSGEWYLNRSQLGFVGTSFGNSNDVPTPADYDGDGKTDVAVFRPSSGTWYLQRSMLGFTGISFGISTDLPVAADYDGDGKADVAVYRAGTWYLQQSTAGFTGVGFGASGDKPIPNVFVQ